MKIPAIIGTKKFGISIAIRLCVQNKNFQRVTAQGFAKRPELQELIFEASQTNGSTARDIGAKSVKEWLEYRVRFGCSEFNSDTYGPIAFKALESLAVCSDDEKN